MDYSDRWDYILRAKNMNIRQFSIETGITRATIYRWKNSGKLPDDKGTKAIKDIFPDLNFNWFFFDEGTPFLEKNEASTVPLSNYQLEEVSEKMVHENVTPVRVPKTEWDLELITRIERLEAIVVQNEAQLGVLGKDKVYLRPELYFKNVA